MNDCGAHKDRHQKLGLGKIGEEALKRVVTHPALQGRPFILETPNEDDGYAREIAMVRKWQGQKIKKTAGGKRDGSFIIWLCIL